MNKVIRVELSAIYLVAALLIVSVGALVGRVVSANGDEPYPNLYVTPVAEFQPPREKTVYLTFDDGPSPNTEKILNVLRQKGAKATFFVTAQNVDQAYTPVMLQRIVDEGHTLGLHSYSHEFHKIYSSPDAYLKDLAKLNDYLYETVGVRPRILRFPGGSATVNASPDTMKSLIRELTRRGYQYYDWDVVSGDDTATVFEAGYLAERMVNGVQGLDQAVILLHDSPVPVTTAQAVAITIDSLSGQGYAFEALTEQVAPVHIITRRFRLNED